MDRISEYQKILGNSREKHTNLLFVGWDSNLYMNGPKIKPQNESNLGFC